LHTRADALRYGERIFTLASIPSPSSGALHLGPLTLHAYGLAIACGVLAAIWLANRRWTARGGTADDITYLATWGVPAGIIGARIYHVCTDYQLYTGDPLKAFAIWDGGLGIWGGIAGGVAVGLLAAKRRGLPLLALMDMVAPALALAQAVGRLGNYFNQELFGRPTTLPWALEISPQNRPAGFEGFSTFHPTFLYEGLWNVLLCVALVLAEKRFKLGPGRIFALYVMGYTFARFFIERLRIDEAHQLAGLRVNEWTSLVVFTSTAAILLIARRKNSSPKATSSTNA
jgi:prolipoprotein diacylglyceryl transferase